MGRPRRTYRCMVWRTRERAVLSPLPWARVSVTRGICSGVAVVDGEGAGLAFRLSKGILSSKPIAVSERFVLTAPTFVLPTNLRRELGCLADAN